jgi:hypothetical protein
MEANSLYNSPPWGKRSPYTLLWECKLVHSLWKTVRRLLKRLKIDLPCDPEIPLAGIYLKSGYNKDTCTLMFIIALFTIAKFWKLKISHC